VRLDAVGTPDPVNRTGANARFPGHKRSRPVGRLTRRCLMRPRHYPGDGLQGQSRDAVRLRCEPQAFDVYLRYEAIEYGQPYACEL
jgi:hypothetical protein